MSVFSLSILMFVFLTSVECKCLDYETKDECIRECCVWCSAKTACGVQCDRKDVPIHNQTEKCESVDFGFFLIIFAASIGGLSLCVVFWVALCVYFDDRCSKKTHIQNV